MSKRVAVVSDALSADGFFPHWYRYYGMNFGYENLFVITYAGLKHSFDSFKLGGLIESDQKYHNGHRLFLMDLVLDKLLKIYDVVVHCDVDEFLVADPRYFSSLYEYIKSMSHDHVTAIGFDVIRCEEPPLNLEIPLSNNASLLRQRRFCIGTTSLFKTAIVTLKVNWGLGFHFCNLPPIFDCIYLFHFKFSDTKLRTEWFRYVKGMSNENSFEARRFSEGENSIDAIAEYFSRMPKKMGWEGFDEREFLERHVSNIKRNERTGLYTYDFKHDSFVREIPSEFCSKL